MDWQAIRNELSQAILRAFDRFHERLDEEQVYALCLSVSEDGMAIGLNANTESCFARKLSEERELEDMTPQYERYLRWSPAEWCFEGVDDAAFQGINDMLVQVVLGDGLGASGFHDLIDAMIGSLETVRSMRADSLQGVTMFVTVTDSDDAEAIENRSAIAINPPDIARYFVSRLD